VDQNNNSSTGCFKGRLEVQEDTTGGADGDVHSCMQELQLRNRACCSQRWVSPHVRDAGQNDDWREARILLASPTPSCGSTARSSSVPRRLGASRAHSPSIAKVAAQMPASWQADSQEVSPRLRIPRPPQESLARSCSATEVLLAETRRLRALGMSLQQGTLADNRSNTADLKSATLRRSRSGPCQGTARSNKGDCKRVDDNTALSAPNVASEPDAIQDPMGTQCAEHRKMVESRDTSVENSCSATVLELEMALRHQESARADLLHAELAERDAEVEQLKRAESEMWRRATEEIRLVREEVAETMSRQEMQGSQVHAAEANQVSVQKADGSSLLELLGVSPDIGSDGGEVARLRVQEAVKMLKVMVEQMSVNGKSNKEASMKGQQLLSDSHKHDPASKAGFKSEPEWAGSSSEEWRPQTLDDSASLVDMGSCGSEPPPLSAEWKISLSSSARRSQKSLQSFGWMPSIPEDDAEELAPSSSEEESPWTLGSDGSDTAGSPLHGDVSSLASCAVKVFGNSVRCHPARFDAVDVSRAAASAANAAADVTAAAAAVAAATKRDQ